MACISPPLEVILVVKARVCSQYTPTPMWLHELALEVPWFSNSLRIEFQHTNNIPKYVKDDHSQV